MATLVNKTIKPSGGDYASISAALIGIDTLYSGNLVTADVYVLVEISGDWTATADTTAISATGLTTDATHYIGFYTDTANRARPAWNAVKYRFVPTDAGAVGIAITTDFIRFDGIQFSAAGNSSMLYMLRAIPGGGATSDIRVSNCLCNGNNTCSTFIGDPVTDLPANIKAWNCIGYNFFGGYGVFYGADNAAFVANFYNCTSYKNTNRGFRNNAGTMNCWNCASLNSTNYDFLGTIGGNYNLASDATAPGANSLQSKTAANQFVSIVAGSEDFHLKAGADCIGAGVADPGSGLYSDDMDGDSRV